MVEIAKTIKEKQKWILLGSLGAAFGAVGMVLVFSGSGGAKSTIVKNSGPQKVRLKGPSDLVDERALWVTQVEEKAEEATAYAKQMEDQNKLLEKRMDIMEKVLQLGVKKDGEVLKGSLPAYSEGSKQIQHTMPTMFPAQPFGAPASHESFNSGYSDRHHYEEKPRVTLYMGSLENYRPEEELNHDTYVPAGTYARAVITSAVVASSSTSAQGNPQPIALRIAEDAHFTGGWRGKLKDATVIGACYGDLSSERVLCRLQTLSWEDPSGRLIERAVEGWIIGEDGQQGMRGTVIDKAADVAAQSLLAGLLSGASNFLQFDSTRSVYPVTPFGQQNSMTTQDALKGSAGKGAGNALDRLADFAIKRADAMSPVIAISNGRVVDILFKKGFSLTGPQREKRLSQPKNTGA